MCDDILASPKTYSHKSISQGSLLNGVQSEFWHFACQQPGGCQGEARQNLDMLDHDKGQKSVNLGRRDAAVCTQSFELSLWILSFFSSFSG